MTAIFSVIVSSNPARVSIESDVFELTKYALSISLSEFAMRLRWFKRWALCEVYFGSVGRALKEGQQHAISDFLRHGHQCSKTLFCFRRCLLLCPRGGITWWGGAPKCSSPTQNLFTRPPEASRCFKTPPTVFRRPPEKKTSPSPEKEAERTWM